MSRRDVEFLDAPSASDELFPSMNEPNEMNETATPPTIDSLLQNLRAQQRFPVSTYRFQLHQKFTFRDALQQLDYLARLGVTDCYCSPYLRARPGSTHGYDICDHNSLNPEIGSQDDYEAFVRALAAHSMGQILDFVPNHVGFDSVQNPWLRDVLENGPSSPFARFFDIDWRPVKAELQGKILVPFLGDHYGVVLERGELQLAYEDGGFVLRYFSLNMPVDPRQYPRILRLHLDLLQAELTEKDEQLQELLSILTSLEHLPASIETTPARVAERQREKRVARERLTRLVEAAPRVRQHILDNLQALNGQSGKPASFDLLHELLEMQPYRLAYWKTAFQEINYRRFFDINDLAGIRMEDLNVFTASHALILRLLRDGKIHGLRLDHIDGLYDPAGYVERLQEAVLQEWLGAVIAPSGEWTKAERQSLQEWWAKRREQDPRDFAVRPTYVVAEKILTGNETLPDSWPLHGTSGYDYLNDLNRLFVVSANAKAMKRAFERFTGRLVPFAEVVYDCKKLITWTAMASELNVLAHALNRISESSRRSRDFTLVSLREALQETVACFPVYRTYVNAQGATESDQQTIDVALSRARRRNPAMEPSIFDFLRSVLLPQSAEGLAEDEYRMRLDFAMKFQQYTGPVQAKGMEDTAFYRYNVLLSLNEVGGDPQRFGGVPAQFHETNRRRLEHWPNCMLATATHDTKRGEDARARLNVLSEIPEVWRKIVTRWGRLNARNRAEIDGEPAPDRNDEYLFYQALLGVWPAEVVDTASEELVKRLQEYMNKAIKEAKVHTSWINPNQAYDQAVTEFVAKTLTGPRAARFLAEFLPFHRRIARLGMINSLSQLLLKLVSPGSPDFYQGTELWDFSLVDPDNRRPVDYAHREQLLNTLEPLLEESATVPLTERLSTIHEMLAHWEDGRIKLLLTSAGLRLRRRWHDIFLLGEYLPLQAGGEHSEHIVALARRLENRCVVAVVPRFLAHLVSAGAAPPFAADIWQTTNVPLPAEIASLSFHNVVTGESVQPEMQESVTILRLSALFKHCPVALLVSE